MYGKIKILIYMVMLLVLGLTSEALAEDHADAAAQANNPLANMTAFNLQNYYIGELTSMSLHFSPLPSISWVAEPIFAPHRSGSTTLTTTITACRWASASGIPLKEKKSFTTFL